MGNVFEACASCSDAKECDVYFEVAAKAGKIVLPEGVSVVSVQERLYARQSRLGCSYNKSQIDLELRLLQR